MFRIIAKPMFKDERPVAFLTNTSDHALSIANGFAKIFLKVTVSNLDTGEVIFAHNTTTCDKCQQGLTSHCVGGFCEGV